jgi:hypothetical protein
MDLEKGTLFAVWGDTPEAQTRKMFKLGEFKAIDDSEIPYGYIKNDKGIQYVGELYSIIERDNNWKLV